jgi:hypothetical protein
MVAIAFLVSFCRARSTAAHRQTHGAGPGRAKTMSRRPSGAVGVGTGGMRVKGDQRGLRSASARWRGVASRHGPGRGWAGAANPGTSGASLAAARSPRRQARDAMRQGSGAERRVVQRESPSCACDGVFAFFAAS